MAKDVFLSHSNHDTEIAHKICRILEQSGLDCWIAARDIPPGAEFDLAIIDGIDQCQAIVVVLSTEANASHYVINEVNRAFSQGKAIFTFRVENIKPAEALEFYLARHQWIDGFSSPVEEHIASMAGALQKRLGRTSNKTPIKIDPPKVVDPPSSGDGISTGATPLTPSRVATMLALGSLFDSSLKEHKGPHHNGGRVDCAVFAPAHVERRESVLIQIFAFAHGEGDEATKRAREFDDTASRRGLTTLEVLVHLGQVLEFHVALHGHNIQDPIRHLTWHGETTSVTYRLSMPLTLPSGNLLGTVIISTGGIPVGRIDYKLVVVGDASVKKCGEPVSVGQAAEKFRKAFVSYSSKDRPEVLRRIQMLRPPLTDIRVFQDILDLEPGEQFKEILRDRIKECDIFLLFWSTNAQQSVWVQNEIQWACDRQGPNGEAPPTILPVIIEGPPPPPPPPQLGHLNFNDYFIYLIQSPGPTARGWGLLTKMAIIVLVVVISIAVAGMAIKWGIIDNPVAVDGKDQPPKNSKKSPAPLSEPPDVVDLRVGPFSLSLPKKFRRGDPINAFPVEGRPDAPGWIVAFSRAEGLPLWYVQDYKEIGSEMTLRFTWVAAVSEAEVLLCQVPTNELPAAIRDKKSGFNRAELEKLLPQSTWSAPQQVSIVK